MKILLLAPQPFFQPRGTPLATRALLEVLAARGYEIHVLTYHEGEDVQIPNCVIHRIRVPRHIRHLRPGFSGRKLVCDWIMLRDCLRMVREQRFDLVHAIEEGAFMAAEVKRRFGIPYVYDMDSSLAQQMIERYGWLRAGRAVLNASEKLAVRESVGIVAVCKAVEELALRYDPKKLIARIEDASLLNGDGVPEERITETIGRRGPVVMYVGNLERYQGIDLLLAGFAHALPRAPDAQLVVIGGSAPDVARYARRAAQMGIGDNVHFLGPRPVEKLGSYLRQADVLVSPRSQGFNTPMKVYSYLDSGVALLATRLPTHTQLLDEEIACLVDPEPAALGEGLLRLIGDAGLRAALGARARGRVRQEFSPEAFRRKVNAFYDSIEQMLAMHPTYEGVAAGAPSPLL